MISEGMRTERRVCPKTVFDCVSIGVEIHCVRNFMSKTGIPHIWLGSKIFHEIVYTPVARLPSPTPHREG